MTYTIIKWRDAVHTATHMTMAERMCLLRMQTYADAKTGRCIPGNKRIAREIGSSITVCKRAWAKAIECGLMTREKRSKGGRMTTSETYLTLPTEQQSRAQERTGGRSSSGPGGRSSSGPPVISQSLISQFNKGEPSQSSSTSHTERSMPGPRPNGGGANHEEYEMTDDDRRPSDIEDDSGYDADGYQDYQRLARADEPSGNSGQLPEPAYEVARSGQVFISDAQADAEMDALFKGAHVPVYQLPSGGNMAGTDWHARGTGGHDIQEHIALHIPPDKRPAGLLPSDHRVVASTADQMRADLARPVPQFSGYIPAAQTIAMTGYELLNEVDILKHRAAWSQTQCKHWPTKWDAWVHQFLGYMTTEQHGEWLSAVLECDNVPNLKWQTTCVIRIMSGEKRQQRGKGKGGYGGGNDE